MQFSQSPSIEPNPNPTMPLAAIVSFATDVPSRAIIRVSGGGHSWSIEGQDATTEHRQPVLGLTVGTNYEIAVDAIDEAGTEVSGGAALSFTTPPLPDDFPPLEIHLCEPSEREPAMMVFPVGHHPRAKVEKHANYLVGIDRYGDIVWHREMPGQVHDVQLLSSGNLLWMTGNFILNEIDMLGNQIARWHPQHHRDNPPPDSIAVATQSFHHSVAELPSGNIAVLSHEIRDVDDYPTSDTDPDAPKETRPIIGDTIVEFTRAGEVVSEIKLFDLLDPYRIGYGLNDPFWHMRGYEGGVDWAHANGIAYDASDNCYVISVRHQDSLIKVDRETGALKWILGTHANWGAPWQDLLLAPGDGLAWQYHQHDPSVTPDGNFMVFDNGNNRAVPFDPPVPPAKNRSRAVEFAVNADAKTVEQVWSYGDGEDADPVYSNFVSGAYRLPETGNVYVTFGGVITAPDGTPSANMREHLVSVRMVEVTHTTPPKKVFELTVKDNAENPVSFMAFRSERVPDLRQG